MNPSDIAPVVIGLALIVVTGGVLVLRPLATRLGAYLDMRMNQQPAKPPLLQDTKLLEVVERIEERLQRLEQRQDFTDAMLTPGTGRRSLQEGEHGGDGQNT